MIQFLSLALLLVAPAAPAVPQTAETAPAPARGTAILYRDIGYRGPSITVTEARPDLDLPWPVRSVRIQRGVWELCQRANYEGRCTIYEQSDRSIPSAREYTQSARPVSPEMDGD